MLLKVFWRRAIRAGVRAGYDYDISRILSKDDTLLTTRFLAIFIETTTVYGY